MKITGISREQHLRLKDSISYAKEKGLIQWLGTRRNAVETKHLAATHGNAQSKREGAVLARSLDRGLRRKVEEKKRDADADA